MFVKSDAYDRPRHSIQVVSQRTGLSKDVIRIWERRYGAIEPGRSETGRRIYTDAHIERLLLLRAAMVNGRRIGEVVNLSPGELKEIVESDRQALSEPVPPPDPAIEGGQAHIELCLEAIRDLDPRQLDYQLGAAAVAMPVPALLDDVMAPMLVEIGRLWHAGKLRVGQEHMATSVIRAFLDNLRRTANMGSQGPTVLVTTPTGQNHELGSLMAAVAAATAGWQSLYLNPNVPAADIVAMALQSEARAVALSLIYPLDDAVISSDLRTIRHQLGDETALIVGGSAVPAYDALFDEIGAIRLSRYSELASVLAHVVARDVRT